MTTSEGNKIIAEFMELEKCTDPDHSDNPCYVVSYAKGYHKIRDLKYHSSWDWLYEPYKKFFSLTEFDTVTDGKYHNRNPHFVQRLEDLQKAWSSLEIKLAFVELTKAIEWYKEQKAQVSDTNK